MSGSSSDAVDNDSAQRDSILEQFKNVTGTNNDSATAILEACNWNLELAINMHVDGIQESNDIVELPTNRHLNRHNLASTQPETNHSDSDFVRAPIPPVRQILVDDNFISPVMIPRARNAVFDNFRDFQQEARWQEELQGASSNGESSMEQSTFNKKQTLEGLFRPPLDMMFKGTFEQCKAEGTSQNRWLLVNVQNPSEFKCQLLNRDVWSNTAVKEIVREHFIFWQIGHEQAEGQRFVQFYNVHSYPHVSILDPRTGEKLSTYSSSDADSLCEFITEFINHHPTPNGQSGHSTGQASSSSGSSKRDSITTTKIYDQSEDAQLEAAIAASLREVTNEKVMDEDSSDCQEYHDVEVDYVDKEEKTEDWKDYLAPDDGNQVQFKLNFPDNTSDQISFPANSQVKALFLYIKSKGFDLNHYEVSTTYPKRLLNDLNPTDTLAQVQLSAKTLIHISSK